jgi:hypothetical protein
MSAFKQDDIYTKKLLRRRGKAEALHWLKGSKFRNVGELSHRRSQSLVTELYGLGAVEVWAVSIQANPPYESTSCLVLKLPENELSRRALFLWNNAPEHRLGYDPDVDRGQEYLFIKLD